MSITIGRIENKFWNNSDAIFPNSLPAYSDSRVLEKDDPNMIDFLSGTIYLYGDQWNHCQYKDAYYSLQIHQVIDEDKKYYLYRLERDLWMDILMNKPHVFGNLVNSNDDELLEKHLNRTIATIDNPSRIVTINFGEIQEFNWRKGFTFTPSNKPLPQIVLSQQEFDNLIKAADSEFAKAWKRVDAKLYSKNKNPAVFILYSLGKSVITNGWKDKLRNKINEFVESIQGSAGKELKIGKVTEPAGSKLVGSFCITQKQDGITAAEEAGVRLLEIDLSGLEDIVPLDPQTLNKTVPNTQLYTSNKNGLFSNVDTQQKHFYPFLAKIRRKIRTPINASIDKRPADGDSWGFKPEKTNWRGYEPQVVNWTYQGKKGKAFLWWVDNLNFIVEWDSRFRGSHQTYMGSPHSQPIFGLQAFRDKDSLFKDQNTFSEHPIPWTGQEPFPNVTKNLVPLGLQIFGLSRPFRKWKLFEYTSNRPLNVIEYFSGIKTSLLRKFGNQESQQYWANLNDRIKQIQPSEEFVKFYLFTYLFSWTALFPGSPKYYYNGQQTDLWGIWEYVNNNWYFPEIISSDIWNKDGKTFHVNPFNDGNERYTSYRDATDKQLEDWFITSPISLPEGLSIENGDYLISSQEYEIEQCATKYYDFDNLAYVVDHFYHNSVFLWRLEDSIKGNFIGRVFNEPDDKRVVLCTTLDGKLEIRLLHNFQRDLTLSTDNNQVVDDVDGTTQTTSLFTLLKKFPEQVFTEEGDKQVIKEEDRPKILQAFYSLFGYRVEGTSWTWFNDEDFGPSNQNQLFFDLVGTQWYCFIQRGKISLVSKTPSLFTSQTQKSASLNHDENKDINDSISLIQKINQKVRFQFFGAPYYLNWKTNFSDDDQISMSYSKITPTNKTTLFDEYFLKLETQYDQVYYENVSIPKEVERAVTVQGLALDSLHLQETRNQYGYQIDQDRLKLATDRFDESIKRAQIDLDIQRRESYANIGTTIAGMGLAIATGGIGAAAGATGMAAAGMAFGKQMIRTSNIMKGANLAGSLFFMGEKFAETERRISTDKHMGARELALNSLVINTAHMDRQISTQMAINNLCNTYANPVINDRNIIEEFLKKREWHGKELKSAHLMVFIPSDEQTKALQGFKNDFGVMCDIPDVTKPFFSGMEPDILRFRDITDASLNTIEFEIVRRFFKARLLAGIKIIQTSQETYKLLSPQDYRDQIFKLNSDLFQQKAEIDAKQAQVIELTNKVTTIAQDTRKECAKQQSELEQQIQNIENQLNQVNTQLREKVQELQAFKDQCKGEKDALETQREQWRETETRLNDAIRRVEGQKTALEDSLRKVADERDAAKIVISNLTKQKENLEDQKADIERQLRECLDKRPATDGEAYFDESMVKLAQAEHDLFNWRPTKPPKPIGFVNMITPVEQRIDDYASYLHLCEGGTHEDTYMTEEEVDLIGLKHITLGGTKQELEQRYRDLDYAEYLTRKDRIKEIMLKYKKKAMRCLAQQLKIKIQEPQQPVTRPACADLKQMVGNGYLVDIQPDGVGGSKAEELVQELVESMVWMRKADTDQNLIKYQQLHRFFNLLEELENYPLLDAYEDVKNGTKRIQTARALLNNPNLAGLKAAMDALNYECWKAFGELQEEIKQDPVLEHFFSHLYPGRRLKDLYETVFQTSAEKYIAREKFMQTKCDPDTNAYEYLQDLMTTLSFDISELAITKQKPPTVVELDGRPVKEHIIKPYLGNWYNAATGAGHVMKAEADGLVQFYIGRNYPYVRHEHSPKYAYIYTYDDKGSELPSSQRVYMRCLTESRYLEPAVLEQKAKEIFGWLTEEQLDISTETLDLNLSNLWTSQDNKKINVKNMIPDPRIRYRFIAAIYMSALFDFEYSEEVSYYYLVELINYGRSREWWIKAFTRDIGSKTMFLNVTLRCADMMSWISWAYNAAVDNWQPLFTGRMSQMIQFLRELRNILT